MVMGWQDTEVAHGESSVHFFTKALLAFGAIFPQSSGPSERESSDDHIIDGWNVSAWIEWGRRKSAVATSVCRQNGKLKRENQRLQMRVTELEVQRTTSGSHEDVAETKLNMEHKKLETNMMEDPLLSTDPWAGKSPSRVIHALTANSGAWDNWRGPESERNKAVDDHTNLYVLGAESHLSVSDRAQSDSLRGLPLTRLCRSGDWADSFDAEEHAKTNIFLEPLLDAVPAAAYEDKPFQFQPSVRTWLAFSAEQEVMRLIKACNHSSWDPIADEAMAVGLIVLADTTFRADDDSRYIHECDRGLILSCDQAVGCNIAFLNKDKKTSHMLPCFGQIPDLF